MYIDPVSCDLLREVWDEWDRVSTGGANQVGGVFSHFCRAASEIDILNVSIVNIRHFENYLENYLENCFESYLENYFDFF